MHLRRVESPMGVKSTLGSWKTRWRSSRTKLIWQVVSWRKKRGFSLCLTQIDTWEVNSSADYAWMSGRVLGSTESGIATLQALPQQELLVSVTITFHQGLSRSSQLRDDAWYRCHQDQLRSIQRIMAISTLESYLGLRVTSRLRSTYSCWQRLKSTLTPLFQRPVMSRVVWHGRTSRTSTSRLGSTDVRAVQRSRMEGSGDRSLSDPRR